MRTIKNLGMFLYVLYILVSFDRELAKKGFNDIFKDYSTKYSKGESGNNHISNVHITEIINFFEMLDVVCAWYPKKADCIHKTLIGYKMLQLKYGISVEMVVGIRKFPFQAHAWLKFNEENFFENEEDTTSYKVILSSDAILEEV